MGCGPSDVLLVGDVELGAGLSPAVKATVPAASAVVLTELARLGYPATERGADDAGEPCRERTAT